MSTQPSASANTAAGGATPHLRDYFNIVYRHRAVVGLCLAVLVGWSVLSTLTTQPQFSATTTVHIEPDAPKILSFQEMFPVEGFAYDFYQTQYQLIGSRAVAWRVVDREGLLDHPDFGAGSGDTPGPLRRFAGWVRRLPKTGARLLRSLAGTAPPSGGDLSGLDTDPAYRAATDAVLAGLSVESVRDTRIARISWSGSDPAMAARIANAVAAAYIELSLEAKFETTQQANEFLTNEIDRLRSEISVASTELQQFGSDVLSLDERQDTVTQALTDLGSEYTRALTARVEKESAYRQLRSAEPSSLPQVYNHDLIQGLKADYASLEQRYTEMGRTYTDEWSEMRQLKAQLTTLEGRIADEEARVYAAVLSNAEAEFQAARERESRFGGLLDDQKQDAVAMNRNLLQFQALQVEIDNKKRMLDSLLERQSETAVAARLQGLRTSNIRVVDAALVPDAPYAPSLKMNLLLGILVGAMLGVGLAFFFDYMNNTLQTADEVENYVGVPALAMIPRAHDRTGGGYGYGYGSGETDEVEAAAASTPPEWVVARHPRTLLAEAFRSLRTAVLLSRAGEPPRVVVVTSANPGEGKTTTAINLSASLAQAGKRVLLVDADMRKPRVHAVLDADTDHGLVSSLVGGRSTIQNTEVDNLWLLPAGTRPPNPAELLGSVHARELIEFVRGAFDIVVVDAPPVLAVVDTQVLARHADGVVLVVDARRTPRPAVRLARRRLETLGVKVLGVSLNRARAHAAGYASYGYGAGGGDGGGRAVDWRQRLANPADWADLLSSGARTAWAGISPRIAAAGRAVRLAISAFLSSAGELLASLHPQPAPPLAEGPDPDAGSAPLKEEPCD